MQMKMNIYRFKNGRNGKPAKKLDKADVKLQRALHDANVFDIKLARLKEAMKKNLQQQEEIEKEAIQSRDQGLQAGLNAVQVGNAMLVDSPACGQSVMTGKPEQVAPVPPVPAQVAPAKVRALEPEGCLHAFLRGPRTGLFCGRKLPCRIHQRTLKGQNAPATSVLSMLLG